MKLIDIIRTLQATKGAKAKMEFLQQHQDDSDLQSFLKLCYEPTMSYYVTELPAATINPMVQEAKMMFHVSMLEEIARRLSNREVTGFAARQYLSEQMLKMDFDSVELLKYMIMRDIKAGVAASTINKVWPSLVKVVPYRRCVLPKDSKIKEWAWGQPGFFAYSQLKADGQYANVNVDGDKVIIETRNGSVYDHCTAMSPLIQHARAFAARYPYAVQIQGELLVKKNGVLMNRQEGNGILNSILQTGDDPGTDYEVVMICWDTIPLAEAVTKGKGSKTYQQTYTEMVTNFQELDKLAPGMFKTISLIETRIVTTYAEAQAHFIEVLKRGLEGNIIKHKDAVWMDGDDKLQVKGKLEFEVELQITGFKEADKFGKFASTFGSLQGESADGLLEVGVSGMPDDLRKKIHENREFYLGKIMTVRANDIMYSADLTKEKHSLFLPRLVEIRLDKTQADTFQRIVEQREAAILGL